MATTSTPEQNQNTHLSQWEPIGPLNPDDMEDAE